jgi:hypothetical protein
MASGGGGRARGKGRGGAGGRGWPAAARGRKGGRGGRRKKKPLTCGPHTSAGERGRWREERERRRSGPRGPKAELGWVG